MFIWASYTPAHVSKYLYRMIVEATCLVGFVLEAFIILLNIFHTNGCKMSLHPIVTWQRHLLTDFAHIHILLCLIKQYRVVIC